MNCQWRAGRRRKKSPARIEVKTTPKHDKKEQEKANHQRALFDVRKHSDPPEQRELFDSFNRSSALT
jgi:hypothetical protein